MRASSHPSHFQIDLAGLEGKWQRSGSVCAVCGFDYNRSESDGEDHDVPLLLFRGKGEQVEMLTLCWGCAQVRMKRTEMN